MAKLMKKREELFREGRIVLYHLRSSRADTRKQCLGYELGVTKTANGKLEQLWSYEATELHWATGGVRTLLDAQKRQVLDHRQRWRPYSATGTIELSPQSESSLLRLSNSPEAPRYDSRATCNSLAAPLSESL
jgi:hypothetical protein